MSVFTVLKVLFRVFIICVGLLSIASGGLCVIFGGSSRDGLGIALLGLVGMAVGGLAVWWVFRSWRRSDAKASSVTEDTKQ